MLKPSFIQEVAAVDGEMRHSKMAEEPMDSASVSTISLISVTNLSGTAFSWYVKGGSSGGFSPPLPGLNFLLSASRGEGVFLAANQRSKKNPIEFTIYCHEFCSWVYMQLELATQLSDLIKLSRIAGRNNTEKKTFTFLIG